MILKVHLQEPKEVLKVNLGIITKGEGYPDYKGPYEAIPKVTDQVFPTNKKSMNNDFMVKQITFQRTYNESGGYTVTIGDI